MPREGGASSTPRLVGSITGASGILDRPPSRTMTTEYAFAFSRRRSPEVWLENFPPSLSEGAGKTGCTLHPRSRVQLRTENAHTSIQVQAEHPGLPCAVALRLTSCSPRRTALLPPSPPRSLLLENLTPAPRRQDHTTSPYAQATHVDCGLRVHRIPPHVRDDREPPLSSGETGGVMKLIWVRTKAEYFCAKG